MKHLQDKAYKSEISYNKYLKEDKTRAVGMVKCCFLEFLIDLSGLKQVWDWKWRAVYVPAEVHEISENGSVVS